MNEPPHTASREEVARFAGRLPLEALACRSSSHVWSALTSTVQRAGGRLYWLSDCSQCGTVRTIVYTTRGYIVGRRYEYPDGYQEKGLGHIDRHGRAVMRTEMFRRLAGA